MKRWRELFFPALVGFCAIAVSGSAAFYSVTGLSKLFAGASLQVMIMASSLEISKLVIASLLYRYWSDLNKILKYYLTLAAGILVIITSMGIYGFLSSAYQETASIYQITNTETVFLEQKQKLYQDDIDRYDTELERISLTIGELSKAKAREIQIVDTNAVGGIRTTVSTSELRLAESRIRSEEQNRTSVISKRDIAADSLRSIQTRLLELKVSNSSLSELGPLIYISNLTGAEMDEVVNILLLAIIFVFDPLAISLVIAANFVHLRIRNNEELEIFQEEKVLSSEADSVEEEVEKPTPFFSLVKPEDINKEEEKPKEETSEENNVKDEVEKQETLAPIVKVLQRTPSSVHVLRSNGKRDKLSKEGYQQEIDNQ